MFCRGIYAKKIKKATSKRYRLNRLSVIPDGAGGPGTKNQPRMRTQMKNDPSRQKALKTKMTFCVVHGVGTYIYSSYPTLGKQGGNLTLEVIFRGDETYHVLFVLRFTIFLDLF
jgi:hypothetical protein